MQVSAFAKSDENSSTGATSEASLNKVGGPGQTDPARPPSARVARR